MFLKDFSTFVLLFAGNSRWVHEMNWSGQKAFAASQIVPFLVDGKEAGLLKTHGPLAFLKVTLSINYIIANI